MGQALGAHCKFKNDLEIFCGYGFTTEEQAVANKRVADAGGPAIFCSQIMESCGLSECEGVQEVRRIREGRACRNGSRTGRAAGREGRGERTLDVL